MEQIKVTDELLNSVLPKVCDELVNEWEKSATEEHIFSDSFNRKMRNIIRKHKNKQLFKEFKNVIAVAAAAIIFCIVFCGNTLEVRANFDVIFKRIETILDDSFMYTYREDSDMHFDILYEPGYIPKGYTEVSRTVYDNLIYITYLDKENNYINWSQFIVKNDMVIGFDAEYDEVIEKEYLGENLKIHVYESGLKALYYEYGNYVFYITATDISTNDIFKMIKEIEQIE